MASRVVSILALFGLAAAAWYSVLIAISDVFYRENSLSSAQKAVRLAPGNAVYHALLAEMLEVEGQNPDSELRIATDLSPRESIYWIRRAFRAEVEQKYDESERFLNEAYRVDRGFDPRWALMNYYFRRGKVPQFWKSAREALEMSYGNRDPVFRLCLAMNEDPSVTRAVIPKKREILYGFFLYLVQHQRIQSAAAIAGELAPGAEPEERPGFLDYCNQQMEHDVKSSLIVWNALCRRRLINFSELAPEAGRIITNSDFSAPPLQHGFDWKYSNTDSISVSLMETLRGISIDISGKQPDLVPILEEEIPLVPGEQYVLSYDYRLVGTQPDSGLQWVVRGAGVDDAANSEPIASSPVLTATEWSGAQLAFAAGQRDLARLILQYGRAPATLRWTGKLELRRVTSALGPAGLSTSGSAR
jgi:hypothetical protein